MAAFFKNALAAIGIMIEEVVFSLHLGARFGGWLFTRRVFRIWATMGAAIAIGFIWIALIGPHMNYQQHVRPYEQARFQAPLNSVPVEADPLWQDSFGTAPPAQSPSALKDGKIFYGYYCAFCHGQTGRELGPVGKSFFPPPAPLISPRVRRMNDSALVRRMVDGVGHQDFIASIVAPYHRPVIAAYIRNLQGNPSDPSRP
jgi:hypothetical protein